jgi:hypothetical protein
LGPLHLDEVLGHVEAGEDRRDRQADEVGEQGVGLLGEQVQAEAEPDHARPQEEQKGIQGQYP